MTTFAYCRVSTSDQTTDNQVLEIARAGFIIDPQNVVGETVTGTSLTTDRNGFSTLSSRMESGDVLVVTKIDRLGRSAADVMDTVKQLEARGVKVVCIALGGTDLTSPSGKMLMGVVAMCAEFERDLLSERTKAGIERARIQGKQIGAPESTTPEQQSELIAMMNKHTIAHISRETGLSRKVLTRLRDKKLQKSA